MCRKQLENMKNMDRKLQGEFESLTKAHEHSKNLIATLEAEKIKFQTELAKYVKDHSSGLISNLAMLEKNKVMHQLSEFELESLEKVNRADIKSEYAQTAISGKSIKV